MTLQRTLGRAATPRWVEPLAWDGAGRLYSLWTDKKGVRLARSDDRGATWTTSTVAETAAPAFFPYVVARGRGELAATWFTAANSDMHDLQWHAVRIDGTRVRVSAPQSLESRRARKTERAALPRPCRGVSAGRVPARREHRCGDAGSGVSGARGVTWWRLR